MLPLLLLLTEVRNEGVVLARPDLLKGYLAHQQHKEGLVPVVVVAEVLPEEQEAEDKSVEEAEDVAVEAGELKLTSLPLQLLILMLSLRLMLIKCLSKLFLQSRGVCSGGCFTGS